eukprot:499719-Pyramimonas_sp.AAC.2
MEGAPDQHGYRSSPGGVTKSCETLALRNKGGRHASAPSSHCVRSVKVDGRQEPSRTEYRPRIKVRSA